MTFERSQFMNRFAFVLVSALVLVVSACGGGSSTPPGNNPPGNNPPGNNPPATNNPLAGSYLGNFQNEVGPIFFTGPASFEISTTGQLTGTVTAEDPSGTPVGEKATLTGTVTTDNVTGDAGFASMDITVESPTLGKYTLTGGTGQYGTTAGKTQFAISGFTVKDSSGTFLGTGGTVLGNKQ
jgi:hypothetical protein